MNIEPLERENTTIGTSTSSLGAKTLEREVNVYLEWVRKNLPSLAARDPAHVRRVIVRALNDTRVLRLVIQFGAILLAVGFLIVGFWLGDSSSRGVGALIGIVGGAVASFVAVVWSRALVRRKIESTASEKGSDRVLR